MTGLAAGMGLVPFFKTLTVAKRRTLKGSHPSKPASEPTFATTKENPMKRIFAPAQAGATIAESRPSPKRGKPALSTLKAASASVAAVKAGTTATSSVSTQTVSQPKRKPAILASV